MANFHLSKKLLSSVKKWKFKINIFDYDVIMTSRSEPYDTHPGLMINLVKFNICTSVVSEELKRTYVHL